MDKQNKKSMNVVLTNEVNNSALGNGHDLNPNNYVACEENHFFFEKLVKMGN